LSAVAALLALLEGLRARACSSQTLTDRLRELAGAAAGGVSLRHPCGAPESRCRLGHM